MVCVCVCVSRAETWPPSSHSDTHTAVDGEETANKQTAVASYAEKRGIERVLGEEEGDRWGRKKRGRSVRADLVSPSHCPSDRGSFQSWDGRTVSSFSLTRQLPLNQRKTQTTVACACQSFYHNIWFCWTIFKLKLPAGLSSESLLFFGKVK